MNTRIAIKVADEVWIAVALLHRENPERSEFSVQEIVDRAAREGICGTLRPGVSIHAYQHCVANRPPRPGNYRILTDTGKSMRRLFRAGDDYHPDREKGKTLPKKEDVPEEYWPLLDWYKSKYAPEEEIASRPDPIAAMTGMWKGLWKDDDPDQYVRNLREWDR